jgi:carboxyl-terminal processing protease
MSPVEQGRDFYNKNTGLGIMAVPHFFKITKRLFSLVILSSLLALLLAACGDPNTTPISYALPTNAPTSTPEPTATPAPTATSAPTATPTTEPPATAAPTNTPRPNPTTAAAATPAPNTTRPTTPTPTVQPAEQGQPAALNADDELKVIKAAYDAINKNYYTQPDTAKIAQKGLEEAAVVLGLSPPAALQWADVNTNWQIFDSQFRKLIADAKTKQLPPRVLAHNVAEAMTIAVGDLHTYFLDEARTDAVNRQTRNDNSNMGFGVTFNFYQNEYYVVRLVSGSPAEAAGLKVGDKLITFNGVKLDQSNFRVNIGRPVEGQSYNFVVERPGQTGQQTIKVTAGRYKIPTAEWRVINGNVGYIVLNAFHMDVHTELDKAVEAVRNGGATSLIIDLRYNGGGYNFHKVAGRFIKEGSVLGKFVNRGRPSELKADSDRKLIDPAMPLAVLIDRGSGSASEVFSLAVREYNMGTLVGGKSAGAIGTVRFFPLGDGTSIGVTNSVYETVKGEKLNGIGVTPDIQVTRTPADIFAGRDPQLDAALKHLEAKAKEKP